MNRQKISSIAHLDHPIAAPLTDESVRRLLDRALPRGDERVLDLGCARGEWLVRAVEGRPGLSADGVDLDVTTIERASAELAGSGPAGQITLHAGDANDFDSGHRYDLVLCVGATHAFGGLLPTLESVSHHLAPGGSVLVGEGYWQREPTPAAVEIFGGGEDPYHDLATTVEQVVEAGWTPVYGHTSTAHELDDYEWCWTGTLSRRALDHPEDPDGAELLKAATIHREEWLRGYRDIFGFVTLQLRRTSEGEPSGV
ncbi:cyclopropane-fatty-acyl-phospholipid synthase family protein [Streptacidiphilus sp. EB129]|uniref:SAM-dependent methyltransferase n=1 Tax=Streptacidiphilus sp. EB129 TaxID=3156262 RepID=UPI003515F6AA